MDKETLETGLRIRTEVLGKEYVENSMKNADDFNRPFQEFVSEYCWGAGWGREGLSKKERSMLNLAMIAILNRPHELKLHIRGAISAPQKEKLMMLLTEWRDAEASDAPVQ